MISSKLIKRLAAEAGFDLCGLTPCRHLSQNEFWFREWLGQSYQSSLEYMERNLEKRFDPRQLVEGAQTAVICAVSYKSRISEGYPADYLTKVASFGCTTDYHASIRVMLEKLFAALKTEYPDLEGRPFVDTAPLLEKQLAVDAGLGWIGRQSLLVTPQFGSFVLLGELLLTAQADCYDEPYSGADCGRCRICIESCPTGAIVAPKVINTSRCISCHTIEKEPLKSVDLNGWIFGCEHCQSSCPYNEKAPIHTNPSFDPLFDPLTMGPAEWLAMDEEGFAQRLGTTPLSRSGLKRIQENIKG